MLDGTSPGFPSSFTREEVSISDFDSRLDVHQRRPRRVIRTRFRWGRAVFVFRASERGVVFICQFDRKRARRCGPRFVRWFRPGRHVLRVRARDFAGNADPTPVIHRFRVKRVGK